jgi:sphingomyelin phosphodiesterase
VALNLTRDVQVGAEANCTKSICCRDFDDSPAVPTVPAGPNGNSHCDSTITLADSMLEEVERLNPRFSIFTGDGEFFLVLVGRYIEFIIWNLFRFPVVEGATWIVDQA